MQAVTEVTPWEKGLIGVNSFGLGGTNANVVLETNSKEKSSSNSKLKHRILILSGRNKKGLTNFVEFAKKDPENVERIMLLNNIFYKPLRGHEDRAYLTIHEGVLSEEFGLVEKRNREIWFIYSGIGSQWPQMCRDLMKFKVFRKSMESCAKYLLPYDIDLIKLTTEGEAKDLKHVTNCFVSIVAMSICLTDILKLLEIEPNGMIGHSLGEICEFSFFLI